MFHKGSLKPVASCRGGAGRYHLWDFSSALSARVLRSIRNPYFQCACTKITLLALLQVAIGLSYANAQRAGQSIVLLDVVLLPSGNAVIGDYSGNGDSDQYPVHYSRQLAEEAARQAKLVTVKEEFEGALVAGDIEGAGGHLAQLRELDSDGSISAEWAGRLAAEAKNQLADEMVRIPGGTFRMGGEGLYEEGHDYARPVHRVTVPSFLLGKHEVTFAQWDACVATGGCGGYKPHDEGWGRGGRPVINVSWEDAQLFIDWLNANTDGGGFRLPSEAEWEYAARAGTETAYSWGNEIGTNRANCWGCGGRWDDRQTAPVGWFAANAFGVHDMHGNVWEWVEDCWNEGYAGAPSNGNAWRRGDCGLRVVRGGSLANRPEYLHSAYRERSPTGSRFGGIGFRVARTVVP